MGGLFSCDEESPINANNQQLLQPPDPLHGFYISWDWVTHNLNKPHNLTNIACQADECSVCLEVTDEDPYLLPCGHVYHRSCLFKWFKSKAVVCSSNTLGESLNPIYAQFQEGLHLIDHRLLKCPICQFSLVV